MGPIAPEPKPNRAARALALKRAGKFYWEIGRELGDVSPERARQLCCCGLRQERSGDDDELFIQQGTTQIPDNWPVALLPMTKIMQHALLNAHVETLGQLRRMDLTKISGIGKTHASWLTVLMSDLFAELPESPIALAKIKRLEADNLRLRARLKRIIEAAKYVADEEQADAMGTDPAAGAASAPAAVVAAGAEPA